MQTNDLVSLFTERLRQAEIQYMITGSIACIIYGEPRLTHDIDLVVEMNDRQIQSLQKAFPDHEFYCPPEETLRIDIQRTQRGSFNIIHHTTGFKADFYLAGEDPIQKWGLINKKPIDFSGTTISVASPEYVILRKLEYFREGGSEKHIRDIAGILRQTPDIKENGDLLHRLEILGLKPQWNQVQDYLKK